MVLFGKWLILLARLLKTSKKEAQFILYKKHARLTEILTNIMINLS